MKTFFILVFSLLLIACGSNKEIAEDSNTGETSVENVMNTPNGALSSDTSASMEISAPSIDEMDQNVQLIKNKMASASAVGSTIENEEFCGETDHGCSLTAIYFNDELITFKTWYGFTNGYQKIFYYLEKGEVLKVEEFRYEWEYIEETGEFNYDNPLKNFEGHYYFKEGKLIHQTTSGHNRFENDELDPETVLLEEVIKYKSYFQN